MKFSTKAIHRGQEPEKEFGSVMPPIFQTSTYVQKSPGQYIKYDYTRAGNPNFTRLEEQLAALENGKYATIFSSGLGAIMALISTLKSGDEVIAVDDLYGGTYRLFTKVFEKFGIVFKMINMQDISAVKKALKTKLALVLIETPTNPLLKVVDIKVISDLAHRVGSLSVVDNTFATPYFQNPLVLGADIVIHSTTKYIGGHSDVIGGVVITNDEKIKDAMDFARKAIGLNPSPFDAWLTTRGAKTLALRMEKHAHNARAVANFFYQHPLVRHVYYPGLAHHQNQEVARKQMRGYGGIVSVDFKLPVKKVIKLISSYKVFLLAESLGGVESLVNHPAIMTHASIPKKERMKIGITDSLVRFSVGVEDLDDILNDLRRGWASLA